MRFLITGGAGFIGSHIVEAVEAAGYEAVVLDPAVTDERADRLRVDVRDEDAVLAALDGVDAVCHQAAKVGLVAGTDDFVAYTSTNDVGTATLLAAMARAGVGSLVLASSMVVYGEGAYHCPSDGPVPPGPRRTTDLDAGRFEPPCPRCGGPLCPDLVDEDASFDPRNVYAATKAAQEHLANAWARATGGRVLALRYHNVYGPRLPKDTPYAGVAALFRSALRRGESPRVFEDGRQRRDFVHVRDVANANVAALTVGSEVVGDGMLRAYNVASGQPRTVGDMAEALAKTIGGPTPVVTGEYRLGDVRHITAASARIRAELGWLPSVTFDDGMAELAAER